MDVGQRVGGRVGEDEEAVVAVVGVADGREDDAAGADPGEDEGVDAAGAQLLVEVGGENGADAGLADDDVALAGRDPLVDLGRRRVGVHALARHRLDPGHRRVVGHRVEVRVGEGDPDVADGRPRRPCRRDRLLRPGRQMHPGW